VAIGRALVREVKVFLLDEPLSNLDAKLRAELRRELKQLHQDLGATMVYVTHDQVEAMTLATRMAVMRAGKIQQFDRPEQVYARPANIFVAGFLGSPSMNFIPGQLRLADGRVEFDSGGFNLDLSRLPLCRAAEANPNPLYWVSAPSTCAWCRRTLRTTRGRHSGLIEPMGANKIVWLDASGCAARPAD
jgi:multiple sugar transport system ATP-binding protein